MDPTSKRIFDTGATRDTATGKLDYVKGLSMKVLHRYMTYLDSHRTLPDGSLREFDNWKKGMPESVYLSSLTRHVLDEVRLCDGEVVEDNHGRVDEEDLLCAVMFNAMGKLYEVMKRRATVSEACTVPISKPGIEKTPYPDRFPNDLLADDLDSTVCAGPKPLRVYVSHCIRGKNGKDATQAEMDANCADAIAYTNMMRQNINGVDFYCPAEHEDFVGLTFKHGLLTEDEILDMDCAIIDKCDAVLFYNPGGFMSNGMKVEEKHAKARGVNCKGLYEYMRDGDEHEADNSVLYWLKTYVAKKAKGESL